MAIIEKTQCPHCKSTFKVQEDQLKAANGKVRCGACMNVFDAIAYGFPERPSPVKDQPPLDHTPAPHTAEIKTQYSPVDELEAILAEEQEEETLISDNPIEDKEDEHYSGNAGKSAEFSTEFRNLDSDSQNYSNTFHTTLEEPSMKEDESWAEEILEEIKTSNQDKESFINRAFPEEKSNAIDDNELFSEEFREAISDVPSTGKNTIRAVKEDAPKKELSAIDQQRELREQKEKEKVVAFDDLRHQPLELEQPKKRKPIVTFIWASLNLALLGLIAGQLAWLYFDKFSRIPELRPAYLLACDYLHCKLPPLIDLRKIKSQNLIVRSHPTVPKALIIDTTIINEAKFNQDFPRIALSFSDINDNIIAQRLFTPNEYLSGEVAQWKTMPSNKPIHIGMEVIDPGKAAVNYSLQFFPANN